jgi:hypothetical protein
MRTSEAVAAAMFFVVLFIVSACSLVRGPSGFWKTFRSDLVVDRYSDQGPWGGLRWLHWSADTPGTFGEDEVVRFAEDNGWKFLRREEYTRESIVEWVGRFFPLNFQDHDATMSIEDIKDYWHVAGPCLILTFDSGWMREDPGTNEMSTAFGYVALSQDGRKLAIYHFWGNVSSDFGASLRGSGTRRWTHNHQLKWSAPSRRSTHETFGTRWLRQRFRRAVTQLNGHMVDRIATHHA